MTKGSLILEVVPGSLAAKSGILAGERLISINGSPVTDELDLAFLQSDEELSVEIADSIGKTRIVNIQKRFDDDAGIRIEDMQIRRCNSKCIFCFIDQNPPNLRQTLYFKDGDFRMSFLQGNYITANELTARDIKRIIGQRLSPLYISVHTTNSDLRAAMLGVRRAPNILDRMRVLTEARIQLHAQIVLCPGWNDGKELERTVRDLVTLGPQLLSVAVVPVGLTDYRENLPDLHPVTPDIARKVLEDGERLQKEFEDIAGEPVLFFSDEFYILAKHPWPDYSHVDVLHQLENGVGMLFDFYRDFAHCKIKSPAKRRRVAILTGLLGARALEPALARLNKVSNLRCDEIPITNTLFGQRVTVSGLLPGRDFLQAVQQCPEYDLYLIPENALRRETSFFLDDMSVEDLVGQTGKQIVVVGGDARALAEAATEE